MVIKQTVAPTVEPVSLTEAKSQCRVDTSDDDTFIEGLITAARETLEKMARRAFNTQTWRLSLNEWPSGDEIELPKPPLQSVTSIVYTDSDGAATTWSSSAYEVDTDSEPGRVKLAYGEDWPSVTLKATNPIQIVYKAGYGDEASDVPQWITQAILLLVGHWYENREATIVGTIIKDIPLGVDSLIWLNRAY